MQHMLVEYSISSGLHADANFYTNAAGKTVSHWFGFGLMDAEAMVDNAPSWKNVPSSTICSSTQIDVDRNSVTSSMASTYSASQCFISYLEHVIVTIRYRASRRGNVEFYLDSPSGTRSKIFRSITNDSSSSSITWDFMSVHTWGENPEGNWTLTMSDANVGTSMNLYYWSIQFYGTVTDPLAGIPAAGEFGGLCIDSAECSALTDGGCLQDGKICVVCNDGYRVIDIYCKQDGRLGGYCDDNVTCATTSLDCINNVCEEKEQDEETDNTPLIVGAVIGACVGIALLVGAGYILYKGCTGVKATSAVTPALYVRPPVYSSQPPLYSSSGATANQRIPYVSHFENSMSSFQSR
ncbi:proprotein convertase subtilisin/kexin type 6-like [Ruditapes philippinarum]|uniref:proprotein convertase subtilisin/kexin type 6-like n=1 Tax=Ruditapes philippinarum TaxID=129788 RepID=UPI00295BCC75|nr:proprotein convertase subtilisin/kexin type 6-like [Ruditapes philippinarum]